MASVMALVLLIIGLSHIAGPKTKMRRATGEPFEAGIVPVGGTEHTISVEFYLVAMFFVIFDLETVFIFAWAIAFYELGWAGYWAIFIFIVILTAALIYEWKSGALDWGIKRRKGLKLEPR
jgi:NADH-quinone oxidoreductase subunit A|tara:strand:+ start:7946 stop:8308 length:363 start_codon:yes stop_codon:yes gene_type:complete